MQWLQVIGAFCTVAIVALMIWFFVVQARKNKKRKQMTALKEKIKARLKLETPQNKP
jgi:hypothetical protein